jgi:hypothetical protein
MSSQPPDNKIIRIPTAENPDGEFGICWRTMGAQILIGTARIPDGILNAKPEPQAVTMATAAPCIGPRCTAWHEEMQECSFIGLNKLQIERATDPRVEEIWTPYLDKILAYIEGKKPSVDLGPTPFDKPDDPNRNEVKAL